MNKNKLNPGHPLDNCGFIDADNKSGHVEVNERNTTDFLESREPSAPERDLSRHSTFGLRSPMNFSKFNTYIKGKLRAEKCNVPMFKSTSRTNLANISTLNKQEIEEETSFTYKDALELFDPDCDLKDDATVDAPNDDDYQRPAKLGLLVGLLRLVNVMSAITAVFGIALSINIKLDYVWRNATISYDYDDSSGNEYYYDQEDDYPEGENYDDEEEGYYETLVDLGKEWWKKLEAGSGILLLILMTIVCCLVVVDNIATVTFRWKQYGELTHRHTDATSIIFLIAPSRWSLRFLSALAIASSASLRTSSTILSYFSQNLATNPQHSGKVVLSSQAFHAVIWYLSLTSGSMVACALGYLLHWVPPTWRSVPWLDNNITDVHVDDVGDVWKSIDQLKNQNKKLILNKFRFFKRIYSIIEIINKFVLFFCLISSLAMNIIVIILVNGDMFLISSVISVVRSSCCCLMCFYFLITLGIQCIKTPSKSGPFLIKLFIPIILSYSFRLLMDILQKNKEKEYLASAYIILMASFLFMQILNILAILGHFNKILDNCFCKFIYYHFWRHNGAYKKVVRVFDTLGSFFALLGLLTGFCSLFIDQYDMDFELTGQLKTVKDALDDFTKGIDDVASEVKKLIKAFDFRVTCKAIYSAVAAGSVTALVMSFIPGGGTVAKIGSKSAYYTVKVGSAFSRLANMLKKSAKIPWKVMRTIRKIRRFTFFSFRALTIGGSTPSLLRLLTFIPPVVVGIHVLFSSFWPKRILFFSSKQRRKFINDQFMKWCVMLVFLLLALAINSLILDVLINVMNDSLPLIKVSINKKLGWKISYAASMLAIAASIAFILSYTTLAMKTTKDHQNITNEEIDWKNELEKRQLVRFKTAHGDKIEHRNQVRYKKERIGPWSWTLPVLLGLIACGFAFLATKYPRIEISREPKGSVGRAIDKLRDNFDSYTTDKNGVSRFVDTECLAFASLKDVLEVSMQQRTNLLLSRYYAFFNKTEKLMRPLIKLVNETKQQMKDKIINKDLQNVFRTMLSFDLQNISLILLIPRVINLLILIFGMVSASLAVCLMRIFDAIEPRKIVDAFGAVCIFSIIYILGTQIAICNILSTFGIPIYEIKTKFGLGFIYDLVCDIIMVSVYIGMKNEFFFAIPKRKVTVTYEVPGVSDDRSKRRGQVI